MVLLPRFYNLYNCETYQDDTRASSSFTLQLMSDKNYAFIYNSLTFLKSKLGKIVNQHVEV